MFGNSRVSHGLAHDWLGTLKPNKTDIDQHMESPWSTGLSIYLSGCAAALVLNFVVWIFTWLASMLNGQRVFAKNFAKIMPQEGQKAIKKASWGCLVVFVLLSWAGFAFIAISFVCGLISQVFSLLRSLINPMPEAARVFEYRLKSDPDMSPEAVWANLKSMKAIESGDYPTVSEALSDLEETSGDVPGFNILKAASLLTEYGVLKYTNPSIADVKKEADSKGPSKRMTHEMES